MSSLSCPKLEGKFETFFLVLVPLLAFVLSRISEVFLFCCVCDSSLHFIKNSQLALKLELILIQTINSRII